jgi:hypothetical protein
MSIVILIGAGASYGSEKCIPCNPPLGNGTNGLFASLIKHNPQGVFAEIHKNTPSLSKIFIDNFEQGMQCFDTAAEKHNGDHLREMSLFFLNFKPQKENLYIKFLLKLKNKLPSTTFVTTNYDMLLELSAAHIGFNNIHYGKQNGQKDTINILKIHGSPNFLPMVGETKFINLDFGNGNVYVEAPIKPMTIEEAMHFCQINDSLAPAIAMYHPEKLIRYGREYVIEQQQMWRSAITEASKCIVIGLKLNQEDQHIWKPLAESKCNIFYLWYGQEDKQLICEWKKSINKKNIYLIEGSFQSRFDKILSLLSSKSVAIKPELDTV